jgi:methyl-accepting chemotaxis protein
MSEQSTNMTQLLSFFRVNSKAVSAMSKSSGHSKAFVAPPVRATTQKTVAAPALLSSSKLKSDSSDEWEEF